MMNRKRSKEVKTMSRTPVIESYEFGQIVIDGTSYQNDVIVLPDGIQPEWWRDKGHVLKPQDLDAVMEAQPEVLVVGQGAYGRMRVTRKTRQALDEAGIELIASATPDAIERYNDLRDEKRTAAALHLTC
jgi:hypothetical protein